MDRICKNKRFDILRDPETSSRVLTTWVSNLTKEPGVPFRGDDNQLESLCAKILAPLADAIPSLPWSIDSPLFRDTVKAVSVSGGWLAETNTPISFISELFFHLEYSILEELQLSHHHDLSHLTTQLEGSAAEAFHLTIKQQEAEAHQEFLRKSTPLVFVMEDIPVLFFLGEPNRAVLHELLERLHVATIRRNAHNLFLDFTGVTHHSRKTPYLGEAIRGLHQREQMQERTIHIVATNKSVEKTLIAEGINVEVFPRHESLEAGLLNVGKGSLEIPET